MTFPVANTLEELDDIARAFANDFKLPLEAVNVLVASAHACGCVRISNQYLEKLKLDFRVKVDTDGEIVSFDVPIATDATNSENL